MAPLELLALIYSRKKGKRSKWDNLIILLVLALAVGTSLAACGSNQSKPPEVTVTQIVTPGKTTVTAEASGTVVGSYTGPNNTPIGTPTSTCIYTLTLTGTPTPNPTPTPTPPPTPTPGISEYGVEFTGDWPAAQKLDAVSAIIAVGERLASVSGGTAAEAFRRAYRTTDTTALVLNWGNDGTRYSFSGECAGFTEGGGCSPGLTWDNIDYHWDYVLTFKTLPGYTGTAFSTLVTHELGHLFRLKYAGDKGDDGAALGEKWKKNQDIILQCEIAGTWRHASAYTGSEVFSDMFTA